MRYDSTVDGKPRVHTQACYDRLQNDIARAYRLGIERGAYLQKWPKACTSCYATGGHSFGGSYDEPPDYDTCPACIDKGLCPRCGAAFPEENEDCDVCPTCGWDASSVTDPMPPELGDIFDDPYDCMCISSLYIEEQRRYYEEVRPTDEERAMLEAEAIKQDEDSWNQHLLNDYNDDGTERRDMTDWSDEQRNPEEVE